MMLHRLDARAGESLLQCAFQFANAGHMPEANGNTCGVGGQTKYMEALLVVVGKRLACLDTGVEAGDRLRSPIRIVSGRIEKIQKGRFEHLTAVFFGPENGRRVADLNPLA